MVLPSLEGMVTLTIPEKVMIKTSLAEYDKMAKTFPLVPIAAEILGDLDTPVTTFLKTTKGKYRFLLESVESETQRGRYSIIGDTPFLIFKSKGNFSFHCHCY